MKTPLKVAVLIILGIFLLISSINLLEIKAQTSLPPPPPPPPLPPTSDTSIPPPPSLPMVLSVIGTTSNSVTLSWTAYTGTGLNFYRIEKKLTGTTAWQTVSSVSTTVRTFTVTGLAASTSYDFRVHAMSSTTGVLQTSNTASATTQQPSSQLVLTAGTSTTTSVPLTWGWTAGADPRTTHYWVYYKFSGTTNWILHSQLDKTKAGWTVVGLNPGTPYDFKIEARDGVLGTSTLLKTSNIVTKTTQSTPSQDITPPTVTVSHTPTSPGVNRQVTINASATDNIQMADIDIYVDDVERTQKVCSQQLAQQITCIYTTTFSTQGPHTYFAQAVDQNGNTARDPPGTGTKIFTVGPAVTPTNPTAAIVSITPNPANLSQPVTFTGSGTAPAGRTIVGYEWNSSRNGFLSSSATFTRSTLAQGVHTITFRVKDSTNVWSDPATATLTIGLAPLPSQLTATINSITPSAPSFGQEVNFVGSGTASFGRTIVGYEWSSNIDGVLGTASSFTTRDLSVGSHTITLTVTDDAGATASTTRILTVKQQSLGSPVQVVPRFVTLGNVVRAYNVTPGYPNVFCKITYGDQDVPCGTFVKSQFAEVCPRVRLNSPVLEFDLIENKSHLFSIAQSASSTIPIEPIVGGGELEVQLLSPSGSGDPQNFGTLADEDFLPSGLKLEIGTPVNIDKVKVGANYVNGVFYSLYKANNCGLKEITPLTPMDYFGRQRNFFVSFIQPSDCELGQTCNYVGEVIALNGKERGGLLYGFSYSRPLGIIATAPTSYDFGNVTPPYTATITITIENTGPELIQNLSAATNSPRLTLSLDKLALQGGETAVLSITTSLAATATAGNYRDEINITSASGVDVDKKVIPITYNVVVPEEIILPPPPEIIPPPPITIGATVSPGTWDIGKVAQNKMVEQNFAFGITADPADVKVEVGIPLEFADSFVSEKASINVGGGETRTKVAFTANKDIGTYSTKISFIFTKPGLTPETIDVPITFEIAEDIQGLLDAAKSEYNQLNSKFENFDAILENNNKLASQVQEDRTKARESLEDAKTALDKAENSLKSKNNEQAKQFISEADDKLTEARRAINNISSVVNDVQETPKKNLLPVFIIVIVASALGFFIFAIREGWIPLYKFPWLKDLFEKIGLGSLIEKPVDLAAKPRFTPQALGVARPQPIVQRPPGAPGQPAPVRPVTPPMTPEQRAKMEAYARQHPEYAAYLKQKQSSYDNRRYE
ncbi:TPA: fibronectin type III domain-containing protein [archaeon]|nr:fibronectin type III domain-containing protein [Candidatus Naiadarchaeales archaeon SRR2090153.bin1042]